jgi:hypothetical protein
MRQPGTVCGLSLARPGLAFVVSLGLVAILTADARSDEPECSPRRYIPARGLVAYLEYEGLDAHARAWEATAAHDMLVKNSAGAMLTEVFKQWTSSSIKELTLGELDASSVIAAADALVRKGFACGFYSGDADLGAIVVLNAFGRKAFAERVEHLRNLITLVDRDAAGMLSGPVRIRGREVYQLRDDFAEQDAKNPLYIDEPPGSTPAPPDPPVVLARTSLGHGVLSIESQSPPGPAFLSAWMEGDDLILAFGNFTGQPASAKETTTPEGNHGPVATVLDTLDRKQPDVTTHPGFISAIAEGKDLKGFEPNGLFFLELTPEIGGPALLLGAGEIAAELGFQLVESSFVSAGGDTAVAQPKAAGYTATGPDLKKDNRLVRTSTDRAEEHPTPAADKAGQKAEYSKPHGRHVADLDDDDEKAARGFDGGDLTEIAKQLGLDGVKRIVGRWGFQDRALLTDVRIEAPAPRKGLTAWFEQPAFRVDRLPHLPAGLKSFVVDSFDLDGVYQKSRSLIKAIDPDSLQAITEFEKEARELIGLRIYEDLLKPIGPTWFLLEVPLAKQGNSEPKRMAPWDHVLVASAKNADQVARVVDRLVAEFNPADSLWDLFFDDEQAGKRRASRVPRLERLPKPDRGYRLVTPPDFGEKSGRNLQPVMLIEKSAVVLAWDLDQARRVLAAEPGKDGSWKPTGELAQALDGLPRDLTFLSVMDNATSPFPYLLADLPSEMQTLVNLLDEPDKENASMWSLLDAFGVPRPGGPRMRIDASKVPDPSRLRQDLLPSVLATATDDRGFRIIGREALPFLPLANELEPHFVWTAIWNGFLPHIEKDVFLTFPRFKWED